MFHCLAIASWWFQILLLFILPDFILPFSIFPTLTFSSFSILSSFFFPKVSFFFFLRLFIHERHTERRRDTGRGRSRLPAGSPMWDSILGPQGHALSWRQMLHHWAIRASRSFGVLIFYHCYVFLCLNCSLCKKMHVSPSTPQGLLVTFKSFSILWM